MVTAPDKTLSKKQLKKQNETKKAVNQMNKTFPCVNTG